MIFDREQFGRNMRFWLKQRKMKQQHLADASGVSRCAINRWIKGVTIPSVECLALIAKALDVTFDDLLKDVVKE